MGATWNNSAILQQLQLTKRHLTANRLWKCLNPTTSPALLADLLIVRSIVRSTALPPGNSTVSTHCHSMPCRTGPFCRDHHSSHWLWRHCTNSMQAGLLIISMTLLNDWDIAKGSHRASCHLAPVTGWWTAATSNIQVHQPWVYILSYLCCSSINSWPGW